MNRDHRERLLRALHSEGNFVNYARVCSQVLTRSESSGAASAELLSSLQPLMRDNLDRKELLVCQKIAFGLSVAVANLPTAGQQQALLSKTLFKYLAKPTPDKIREIVATELSQVDQYLLPKPREEAYRQIKANKIPLTTALLSDYSKSWVQTLEHQRVVDAYQPNELMPNLDVFFVCSAKGGVGKTTVALALLHYFATQSKTGFIDLDFSGPTAQFNLDIPDVTAQMDLLPSGAEVEGMKWRYLSLYDVAFATTLSDGPGLKDVRNRRSSLRQIAARAIFQVKDLRNAFAMVLPDSPTQTALLASFCERTTERVSLVKAMSAALLAMAEKGAKRVVIDCRPGLFGANGFLLRWISLAFPTRILIVGSRNVADIGTTFYEAVWMNGDGQFRWRKPPVYLINRWPSPSSTFRKALEEWTENYLTLASIGSPGSATSASTILASRFWCYLYALALEHTRASLRISPLREEPVLASIMSAPTAADFRFDWKQLSQSTWYRKELVPILKEIQ